MEGKQQALLAGATIDRYEVQAILGVGGFGVTYQAWDPQLAVAVAIKEFLPLDLAGRDGVTTVIAHASRAQEYRHGLDRFLEEARTLARFKHNNVARVSNFLEANGTAYLVMDYEEGQSLSEYLKAQPGPVSEAQLKDWFVPLLRGLMEVHKAGFLHRDIKPGNIYLRAHGDPLLIDFGAARQAIRAHSRSVTGIVSAGYAPTEQYGTDAKKQGPWTDLYSIGATLYRCISGKAPLDAPTRQSAVMEGDPDPMRPALDIGTPDYSEPFLQLIDELLVLPIKQRPQRTEPVLAALKTGRSLTPEEPRSTVVTQIVTAPAAAAGASREAAPAATPAAAAESATAQTHRKATTGLLLAAALVLVTVGGYWVYSRFFTEPVPVVAVAAANTPAVQAVVPESTPSEPVPIGKVFQDKLKDGGQGPQMVVLPTGSFRMGDISGVGDSDEKPVHRVTISNPIAMGKYEVTVGDFRRFVNATGYTTEAEANRGGEQGCVTLEFDMDKEGGWNAGRNWQSLEYTVEENQPVSCVSWNDAQAYVQWLKRQTSKAYRLPSEAEWEYAVRAASESLYHFGNNPDQLCRYGNVRDTTGSPGGSTWKEEDRINCSDGAFFPTRVGRYQANSFGLYDMHGNVWEWVEDCWHDNYKGAPADGSAWGSGGDCAQRVLRDGAWDDSSADVRSADRFRTPPSLRSSNSGFRLVQDLGS